MAKAGPSKSTTKTKRTRTTKKNNPTVAEEEKPEEGEEPAPKLVQPRLTAPVRPRTITQAVEIATPSRPRQGFGIPLYIPPVRFPP